MFNNDKIKEVVIAPNSQYVIWSENLDNVARDAKLTVSAGCVGLYIVNGVLKSVNTPGRWVIKSRDEEKSKSNLQLIGVNSDKVFEIFCGVGNIPFHDYDIDIDATLGSHGDCKLRIASPWALYTTFGHAPITSEEIDEYAKGKLIEIMTSQLSGAASKYDYDQIMSMQSTISTDLEKAFGKALMDIGLEVAGFSVRGISFSPDYLEKRKEHFENEKRFKQEKRERREREREQRTEAEVVAIMNANSNNTPPAPAAPVTPNHTVQYCPMCGTKLPAGVKFCSNCGKKLD